MFARIEELRDEGTLSFAVAFSPASLIDSHGIVYAMFSALAQCLLELGAEPEECEILLDGGLVAPKNFSNQKTIIRGDDSEPVISMASIVAKVVRDRYMERIAPEYPQYGFEVHKGYGTLVHRRAISRFGLSGVHRASFCRRLHCLQN